MEKGTIVHLISGRVDVPSPLSVLWTDLRKAFAAYIENRNRLKSQNLPSLCSCGECPVDGDDTCNAGPM